MSLEKVIPNPGDPLRSALLIIDVQREMFEKSTPVFQADQMLANILTLVDRAHQAQAPVIYIQHNAKNSLVKGTAGWQLHPALNPQPKDGQVLKEHGNAFEKTSLSELLAAANVGRVVAAGMVTHGCVKSTCLGALELGYQVTLAGDAHSSYNADAAAMIAKWNRQLAEQGIEVKDSSEINFS
jgi:nicotinamidase-related amidase